MDPMVVGLVLLVLVWLARRGKADDRPYEQPKGRQLWVNPSQLGHRDWQRVEQLPTGKAAYYRYLGLGDDIALLNKHTLERSAKLLEAAERARDDMEALLATPEPVELAGPAPIHFRDGEPQTFEEYVGQAALIDWFRTTIRNHPPDSDRLPHQLFIATAGQGKTTLAKVLANEWQARFRQLGKPEPPFIQLVASDIQSASDLDQYVRWCMEIPGTLLFIDEVHALKYDVFGDKLLMLLEEGQYVFAGERSPTVLPPFTVLAATTDYSKLHPALKRRFEQNSLERMAPDELADVLRRRPFPIDEDAVEELVHYTHHDGAPWYALQLRRMAEQLARATGATTITRELLQQVIAKERLDAMGLRPLERNIIQALFQCPRSPASGPFKGQTIYVASERNVCAMAGVDPGEYAEVLRPRLMARGLLLAVPQGQQLTELAIARYQA